MPTKLAHCFRHLNLKAYRPTYNKDTILHQEQIRQVDLRAAKVIPANDHWRGTHSGILPKSTENAFHRNDREFGGKDYWIWTFRIVVGAVAERLLAQLHAEGELVFGALGTLELDGAQLDAVWSRNQRLVEFALLPLLTADNMRRDLAELFGL